MRWGDFRRSDNVEDRGEGGGGGMPRMGGMRLTGGTIVVVVIASLLLRRRPDADALACSPAATRR